MNKWIVLGGLAALLAVFGGSQFGLAQSALYYMFTIPGGSIVKSTAGNPNRIAYLSDVLTPPTSLPCNVAGTPDVIMKFGAGSPNCVDSSVSDDGTTVATAEILKGDSLVAGGAVGGSKGTGTANAITYYVNGGGTIGRISSTVGSINIQAGAAIGGTPSINVLGSDAASGNNVGSEVFLRGGTGFGSGVGGLIGIQGGNGGATGNGNTAYVTGGNGGATSGAGGIALITGGNPGAGGTQGNGGGVRLAVVAGAGGGINGKLEISGLPSVAAGTGKKFLCIDTVPGVPVVYIGTGLSCN